MRDIESGTNRERKSVHQMTPAGARASAHLTRHVFESIGRPRHPPMNREMTRKRWPCPEVSRAGHVPRTAPLRVCCVHRLHAPGDAKLEGEKYQRKLIRCSRRHVTLEDLDESSTAWYWARLEVDLQPPDSMASGGPWKHGPGDRGLPAYDTSGRPCRPTRLVVAGDGPGVLEFEHRPKKQAERSITLGGSASPGA